MFRLESNRLDPSETTVVHERFEQVEPVPSLAFSGHCKGLEPRQEQFHVIPKNKFTGAFNVRYP